MASGGHCLINWKTIYCPKDIGGLSLPDLERVGHALHLRWPWLEWTDPDKPWFGSKLPRDEDDMALFRASTKITLGNGKKALFWQDNWFVTGVCVTLPLVCKELENDNWITSISRLHSMAHMRDFIIVASIVANTTLDISCPDSIAWLWTKDGAYSTSSAYKAQFIDSFSRFNTSKI
jgi:hypothetical protein